MVDEKKHISKKEKIEMSVSIILYTISLVLAQLPWFVLKGKRYNLYSAYFHVKRYGTSGLSEAGASIWNGNLLLLKIPLIVFGLYELCSAAYIITVILRKDKRLNIIVMVLGYAAMLLHLTTGLATIADNTTMTMLYPLVLTGVNVVEFLAIRMIDIWKESVEQAKESSRKEKAEKEEERRRLSFPGKYTKLFYQIVWKNFQYDWQDYRLFLLCGTIVTALIFAGIASYQMMAGLHRAENFLIGEGLGLIVWNAMVPIGVCAVFLMVFVLIFYMQKWMQSYSIFLTLGIRKKALLLIIGLEIVIAFICSLFTGCIIGNGIVMILRKCLHFQIGRDMVLAAVTWKTYVKVVLVMFLIYLIALAATRDIATDFDITNAAVRRIRKEKVPRKFVSVFWIIGFVLCAWSLLQYRELRNYENIKLMAFLFLGLFLLIRFTESMWIRNKKKKRTYIYRMLQDNQIYHKSRTSAWYMFALVILHTCALFYFAFPAVSVTIAEKPESLFPYDYVCISDDGDDKFFDHIKETYHADITSFPMVRVTNADKTEKSESIREEKIPQGQQIGISETTYRALKRANGQTPKLSPNALDANGNKVYLVHQQDRSVKAQPVDWSYGKKKPFLHIGIPCEGFSMFRAKLDSPTYIQRTIAGEEFGSLIGCFRQGKLENVVVFSDEYFKKAQKMWKYTNIIDGSIITDKKDRIDGVTVSQGPTKLVLLHVDKKRVSEIENEMQKFAKKHKTDLDYDAEISSYYSKTAAVADIKTERATKQIVNIFVISAMAIASMFLLYVKALSELEDKKNRADFLKCMGMKKKERMRLLQHELYVFYRIPMEVAVVVMVLYMLATFHARMYNLSVQKAYVKNCIGLWLGYVVLEWIFIWILGKFLIKPANKKSRLN